MARKPEYRVAAMDKTTDEKNNIGGAWLNEDGSIAVILDPFIVLQARKSLLVTLFPNKDK